MFVFVHSRSFYNYNYIWTWLSCYIFNYFVTSVPKDVVQSQQNGLSFKICSRLAHIRFHNYSLLPASNCSTLNHNHKYDPHIWRLFLGTSDILVTGDSNLSTLTWTSFVQILRIEALDSDTQKMARLIPEHRVYTMLQFRLVCMKCHYIISKQYSLRQHISYLSQSTVSNATAIPSSYIKKANWANLSSMLSRNVVGVGSLTTLTVTVEHDNNELKSSW